ncbi:ABC-three component system protein [Jeotgalibacillus terrae]|uniref:ABC-three component system protein n=1 Tax=Jeotgalibacillus terrae TaxID=587735 RepID=A0ABW5ZQF0_9BACL|nr:ABC-three component system protein [Jeotgalibacillus terrae]MBM7581126.1 hypothetical protein [Jeotgalibacillus terrae]
MPNLSKSKKTLEFDATNSWNGYSYQGKIALIVVIDLIKERVEKNEKIDSFKLAFERLEDFSILKNGKHIQIHQVKSYASEPLSEYKDAIWQLLGKSVYEEYSTIENSYLHVADVIRSSKGDITSKKLLFEVLDTYSKPQPSKSKIIINSLELYNYVNDNFLKEEAINKFNIYKYPPGKYYCQLIDVEKTVKDKIQEYYESTGVKDSLLKKGLLEKYIDSAYTCMLGLIDNHINNRHINRQKDEDIFDKEICFKDFMNIMDTKYEELPLSYYIYYLKNKMFEVLNSYCINKKQEIETIVQDSAETKLSQEDHEQYKHQEAGIDRIMILIREIYTKYSDLEFLTLCKKINPHLRVDFKNNHLSAVELVNEQFITFPWIYSLLLFHKELSEKNLVINLNKEQYLPTAISHTIPIPQNPSSFYQRESTVLTNAAISKIATSIIENREIHIELYKIDKILTGNIDASLKDYIHKVTVNKEKGSDKKNNHIMDIKNVKLVTLENSYARRKK